MKILKTYTLLLLIVFASCKNKDDKDAIVCLPNNLENGVIAYYTFGNGSLDDKSMYGHNLTNNTSATPTSDRNGSSNCAYQFHNDSSNVEFLTCANTNFLNGLNSFSISLWYKTLQSTRSASDYEILVGRGQGFHCPDRRGEWSMGLYDVRMAVFGHDNSVWASLVPDSVWGLQPDNITYAESATWHHLVSVKTNNVYQLYFDGILQETENGAGQCGSNYTAQDVGDLFIGKDYTGKLDDIIIYNRGLSQQEVNALYNTPPCCE